jgi:hypothetical protein
LVARPFFGFCFGPFWASDFFCLCPRSTCFYGDWEYSLEKGDEQIVICNCTVACRVIAFSVPHNCNCRNFFLMCNCISVCNRKTYVFKVQLHVDAQVHIPCVQFEYIFCTIKPLHFLLVETRLHKDV